jgi:octaprenyl-diphosphate synthase
VKLDTLYGPVQQDIDLVEETIDALRDLDFQPMAEMLDLVLAARGKRLRPALSLLAGKFGRYRLDLLVPLAASIELLHTATLVHDDVIDNATTRRGRPTANSMLHNTTTMTIARGEIGQDMTAYDTRQTVRQYLQRIGGKTASLFAAACQGGALLAEASENRVEALKDYGYNLGMAFQIVDDILDFVGDEQEMGKPVGSDLSQGTLTLPSLLLLDRYPKNNPIRKLFAHRRRQEYLSQAVEMIRQSDIPRESYQIAESFAKEAEEALTALPKNPARRTLRDIVRYVLERRS